MLSLLGRDVTGKDAEIRLGQANITLNKNTVPGETRSPFITSGLRIGTPAMTTRGFGATESKQVAEWIADILDDMSNQDLLARVKKEVVALCRRFPVYVNKNIDTSGSE